jgi:hypothetical protein
MVKKVVICLIVLSYTVLCPGSNVRNKSQKKGPPDLSGTWRLDKSKGNYVKYGGLKPETDLILIISHADPEIKVTRKSIWEGQQRIQEMTYYSDGRGETGSTFIGSLEGKSISKWDGNKFVTRFSATSKNGGWGSVTFYVIQEWKLSADGKTLTQTERTQQTSLPEPSRLNPNISTEILKLMSPREIKRMFKRIS